MKQTRPQRTNPEQRKRRFQQIVFASMAILIILSMLLALVRF